jgi:hypothetical protein
MKRYITRLAEIGGLAVYPGRQTIAKIGTTAASFPSRRHLDADAKND